MRDLLIALTAAALMLLSRETAEAALCAALVFAQSVMPSLFPMMLLCQTARQGKRVFLSTLLVGLCSGSPAGARLLASRSMLLGGKRTLFLCGATGTMSPLFFLGAVASWTGDAGASVRMLLTHWASALLTGAVAMLLPIRVRPHPLASAERRTLASLLSSAMNALWLVLGAMMLGAVVFSLIEAALCGLFPWLQKEALAPMHALFEIGGGANALCACWENPYALLCALCSFGGISMLCQSAAFLGHVVSARALLLLRLLHALITYALYALLF